MTLERVWNCAWEMTVKKWVCLGETMMEMGLFMGDNDGDGSVYGRR